jgi:hypothetical protein
VLSLTTRKSLVISVQSFKGNSINWVVKYEVNSWWLTPLFVRERVCWRPHETLITSSFKSGNMPICWTQLYLDMVGPVPSYKERTVMNDWPNVCKKMITEELFCQNHYSVKFHLILRNLCQMKSALCNFSITFITIHHAH